MIVAVAAAISLAAPSRDALIERWVHASRAHAARQLYSAAPGLGASKTAPPELRALAQRELLTPGRYRLTQWPTAVPAAEPWWRRVWDWLADRWMQFWHALFAHIHVGKEEVAAVGNALLVAIALVLLFAGIRLVTNLQIARSTAGLSAAPLEQTSTPHALYAQACDAASRAAYGNAVRLLFGATVALLDGRGMVDGRFSATVGDLRRELRSRNKTLIASFDAVAGPFVETAYAEQPVNEPQWTRAHDAFAALQQE